MVHCCYTLCCFPPLHWHSLSTATKTNAGSVKYTLCRTDETAGPRLGLSEAWLDSWMWLKGLVRVCVCGGCVSRHMTGLEYISTCLPDCNNQLQISGLLLDNRGWLRLFNHNIFFLLFLCSYLSSLADSLLQNARIDGRACPLCTLPQLFLFLLPFCSLYRRFIPLSEADRRAQWHREHGTCHPRRPGVFKLSVCFLSYFSMNRLESPVLQWTAFIF